jgi:hypothetical protein
MTQWIQLETQFIEEFRSVLAMKWNKHNKFYIKDQTATLCNLIGMQSQDLIFYVSNNQC